MTRAPARAWNEPRQHCAGHRASERAPRTRADARASFAPSPRVAAAALLAIACGGGVAGTVRTQRLDASTFELECQGPLANCLVEADTLCRGAPYTVLTAQDRRDLYGPSDGPSQVEVRSSTATLRCETRGRVPDGSASPGVEKPLPPSRDAATESPAPSGASPPAGAPPVEPPAPAPSAAAPLCVPGSTQQCVGPGACSGGQACLPDGSGFGPCDCGPASGAAGAPGAP